MKNAKLIRGAVIAVALVIAAVVVSNWCIASIPTGHTGVLTTFGKVEDYTLGEGIHLKSPLQQVIVMDNRSQKRSLSMQAFSSDIQQVDINCSIIYTVDREGCRTLYQSVGVAYYDTIMLPRLMEHVKAVFARFTAENLVEVRAKLSNQIRDDVATEMEKYGITVASVSIEDIDFTDAFTNAVEEKQVAQQVKLRVETEQAQQVSTEKAAAERQIIAANASAQEREILAEADAAVKKVNADAEAYATKVRAEAEAEANAKIAASITPELIDYRKAERWDGALPRVSGSNAMTIMDLGNLDSDTASVAD